MCIRDSTRRSSCVLSAFECCLGVHWLKSIYLPEGQAADACWSLSYRTVKSDDAEVEKMFLRGAPNHRWWPEVPKQLMYTVRKVADLNGYHSIWDQTLLLTKLLLAGRNYSPRQSRNGPNRFRHLWWGTAAARRGYQKMREVGDKTAFRNWTPTAE